MLKNQSEEVGADVLREKRNLFLIHHQLLNHHRKGETVGSLLHRPVLQHLLFHLFPRLILLQL
jgi:hypothetical protein